MLGVLTNKATALVRLGRSAEAQTVAVRALELAQSPEERAGYLADMRVVNLGTLALATAQLGKASEAQNFIRSADSLASKLTDRERLTAASACLEALDALRALERARPCAETAAQLFTLEEEATRPRILHLAAKAFNEAGDKAKSIDLQQRAYLAVSGQRRTELARSTATALANIGLAERNSLVGELRDEVDAGRAASERLRLLFALLIGATVTAAIAFWMWSRASQTRRRAEAVRLERQRVARDLHDTATQSVAALALQLQLAERDARDSSYKEQLSGFARNARFSLAQVRDAIWQMRSNAESAGNLRGALSSWLDARRDGAMPIHLVFGSFPASVEPEHGAALLRVVQEAVSNAQVHSRAASISVVLSEMEGTLRARVTDDGIGLAPGAGTSSTGHYGLIGMRERVEALGGRLSVESAPGQGTTVMAELPLGKKPPQIG
jgi:signal transduction histidine kinase